MTKWFQVIKIERERLEEAMDEDRIEAARMRVARRAELRSQAAERAQLLPARYVRSLKSQFEQGAREAQFITRKNQGRPTSD